MASGNGVQPIIKKVKKVSGGGHHGGAWKVAYADFVTAMMAFFLLMWLLNATSEEQRKGIADFFSPSIPISSTPAGGRALFNGDVPLASHDSLSDGTGGETRSEDDTNRDDEEANRQTPPTTPIETQDAQAEFKAMAELDAESAALARDVGVALGLETDGGLGAADAETSLDPNARDDANQNARADVERLSDDALEAAAAEQRERQLAAVESAFNSMKEQSQGNLLLDHLSMTLLPEGLVIEIAEVDGRPLFPSGSDDPTETLVALIEVVAPIIGDLENDIALVGHTDARPYARGSGGNNWRLSAERADAARRLLLEQGLSEARITRISGAAAREPLSDDPYAASNRRIGIVLLRETPN